MRQSLQSGSLSKNKLPTESRLLEATAMAYVASHRIIFIGLPYLWFRMLDLFFLSPNQDVNRYFSTSGQWLQGLTPYKSFLLEYPPGSLLAFTLPRLFTDDFSTYSWLFACEMLFIDISVIFLMLRITQLVLGASSNRQEGEVARRYDSTVAIMAYVAFSGALGYLAFERFDLVFTFLVLLWIESTLSRRPRFVSDLLLALGIWFKLLSIIFIPIYLVFLAVEDIGSKDAPWSSYGKKLLHWSVRQGLIRIACIAAFTTALFFPFYWMAPNEFFNFIKYHQERGIQLESTYASVFLFIHQLVPLPLRAQHVYGAMEIYHPWTPIMAKLSVYFTAALLGLGNLWFCRKMVDSNDRRDRAHALIEASLVFLLLFIGCCKVFSPQYLLWCAPLAALTILRDQDKTRHWLLGFAVTYGLTGLILFFYYINLIWFQTFPSVLLLLRNAFVFIMAWLVCDISCKQTQSHGGWRTKARAVCQHIASNTSWSYVALFFCAAWVFCANLSETTANDIWIQLRSGADMVKTHTLPYIETYSATVSGRPFIAHEWLCGLLFYALDYCFGDAGLSFLAAFVALGIFLLMYYAFEKKDRQTLWYLPLLLFLSYLVAFRVLVRPHIFTIMAQAALMLAIERWRREGGIKHLWWLVPMQLIWINLHGAALFGPCFIAMVAGCVTLMVAFPKLQSFGSETRTFTKRDIWELAIIAVAMGIACIINPYGTRIVMFSIDLFGNSYAKSRVWEWTTPFLRSNSTYYWLWLYISGLILLWTSVLTRLRVLPIIDICYAVLVTYLSTRANRFVPDFAVFSFPVIVRAFQYLAKYGLKPKFQRQQPWLELGLAALLFTNCVIYGYAHSAREHRPLPGWGYGGDMPYHEVALLKRLGIKGTIFNEYSDGSLIINQLVPDIRPVLDSRIDLYPLELVEDYDRAYAIPELFARYIQKNHVNIVLLYRHRSSPRVIQWLDNNPNWRRISTNEGRILWIERSAMPQHKAT